MSINFGDHMYSKVYYILLHVVNSDHLAVYSRSVHNSTHAYCIMLLVVIIIQHNRKERTIVQY